MYQVSTKHLFASNNDNHVMVSKSCLTIHVHNYDNKNHVNGEKSTLIDTSCAS